jgi:hypothetical protein
MRMLALIAFWLLMNVGFGHAQTNRSGDLKGMTKIHLLIETLTDDAKACGITKELIRDAFMYPASSSRLQITSDPDSPIFYIQVSTLRLNPEGICFSSVYYESYNSQFVQPDFAPTPKLYDVVFWKTGSVFFSVNNRHTQLVRENVEDYTKRFLTIWNLDNKPN